MSALFLGPLLVALAAPHAEAGPQQSPSLPSRPLTYPVDTKLSTGGIENFRSLFVDPATVGANLKPKGTLAVRHSAPAGATGVTSPGAAALPILNTMSSFAEVSVNGTRIGVIGPLTNGAIHGLQSGVYEVTFKAENKFERVVSVETILLDVGQIYPGNVAAKAVYEQGAAPLWSAAPDQGLTVAPPAKVPDPTPTTPPPTTPADGGKPPMPPVGPAVQLPAPQKG